MTKTLTPLEIHEQIAGYAKTASQEVRRLERTMKIGEWARQGDLYLIAIKAVPKGAKLVAGTTEIALAEERKDLKEIPHNGSTGGAPLRHPRSEIQLAQGTTMGSRHMLQMREGITFYRVATPGPLDGGTIEAKGRCYITHPEHAHVDLPAGIYEVRYQTDLGADELRAVRD